MQNELFAVAALGGYETGTPDRYPRRCALQPFGRISHSNQRDFAFDTPFLPCLVLFRFMLNAALHYRHAGRRVTQGLALDDGAADNEPV